MSVQPTSPGVQRPIRKHYADRFTVDLDDKGNLQNNAIRAWYYLRRVAAAIDVHVSSSGRGLHMIAYLTEPMSFAEKTQHRRTAGDDARRVDMEIQRWHAGLKVDVVFSDKDGTDGVQCKDRRFADVWDALDFIDAQRDDSDRMRRLANYGHKGDAELARKLGAGQ